MARDWIRLPSYSSKEEAERYAPEGWQVFQIEQLYEQLPVGKRFEQKTSLPAGKVPVIDQSAAGIIGWHNEEPGVRASPQNPVVTFANHTCEMRLMEEPFSVIQNVFPLIGKSGVCRTRFFYYLTKGRVWLEEYKGHFPEFRRKWVCCPSEYEQEQLVKVLGDLDGKIALNRRINQTLEAMAQAIFNSWFVDFDPVKAKIAAIQEGRDPLCAAMRTISGKSDTELDALPPEQYDSLAATAALFPDDMEASELGEIPKGWAPAALAVVCELNTSSWSAKTLPVSVRYVDLANTKNGEVIEVQTMEGSNIPSRARRILETGDTIVGTVRPGNRSFALVGEAGLTGSTGFAVLRPKKSYLREYVYLAATSDANIERLAHLADGGAYPAVRPEIVVSDALPIPQDELLREFHRVTSCMFDHILANRRANRDLAELRDTLLPKLLSGELSATETMAEVEA